MDDGRTITVTLEEGTAEALEASVRAGEHPSIEAAVGAVLDEWWADRAMDAIGVERLREMLSEAAGSPSVDGEEVFARLIAKYEAMAQAKGE